VKTFGLYIHWPFCIKKCPYCDFNSYSIQYDEESWVLNLIKELEFAQQEFPDYFMKTIFFGGGTPSLIEPANIGRLIKKAKSLWNHDDLEITLETNPSSVETKSLEEFMENGINRFSIGMQSLNDDKLQFLGRLHSAQEAKGILTHASSICGNVSGDFIYSLPNDSLEVWKKDLDEIVELALKINLKHISLYQLTIEENTAFEKQVAQKQWIPLENDLQGDLYEHTANIMDQIGWDFYEVSNVSREASFRSRHNLIYWNYENYLGIGPGAHSRMEKNDEKIKFHNIKNPNKWLEKNISFSNTKEDYEIVDEKNQFLEKLLMGLRLKDGIIFKSSDWQYINQFALENLAMEGFLKVENSNNIKLTKKGMLRLNAILGFIIKG
jgi:putative oxygen-independent coproporphyrinogen III oxidase